MRREVLSRVSPRGAGLGDHLYTVLSLLAVPAPFIVRTAVAAVLVISLVASASVASADALPDEPLYGLKVASEQVRLALAQSPADRAAVRLSMAEHRLAEAERLALDGREPEALVAASAYGTQLAEAAAELAAIERVEAIGPSIVARLRDRLKDQQARAVDIAEKLRRGSANARSAPAFDTVASAPPAEASATVSELIAEHAATVTDQVAAAAEQRAQDASAEAPPPAAPAEDAPPPAAPPARPASAQREAAAAGPPQPQGRGSVTVPDPTPEAREADDDETDRDDENKGEDSERRDDDGDDRDEDEGNEGGEEAKEEAKDEDAKRADPKQTPTILEKLSKISQQWKAALEKIKQEQQKAREAQKKAKERGNKTPAPAEQRSGDRDEDRERDTEKERGGKRGEKDREGKDREKD